MLKYLKMKKNTEYESCVTDILKLNNYYKLFPYFLNKSAEYDFNNYFYFTKAEKESKIKPLLIQLEKI